MIPEVEVIHNCTPNEFHLPVAMAAIAQWQARDLRQAACSQCRIDAKAMDRGGAGEGGGQCDHLQLPLQPAHPAGSSDGRVGAISARSTFVHGQYLQDWLLYPTDYNWRLEKEGGASRCVADIGSHWCDLAGYVTGSKIDQVLAEYTTRLPDSGRSRQQARIAFAQALGG
jgi:hypothetical protein